MNDLMHADIFFFVTTIAVVGVAIALIVALGYLVAVLRQIRDVMNEVKEETVLIREDIHTFRDNLTRGGLRVKYFMDFFQNIFKMKARSNKK